MQFKKLTLKRGLRDRVECTFYALQFAGFPLYTKLLVHIYDNYKSFRIDIDQIHDENYGSSSRLIVVLLFDSAIPYSVFTKKLVKSMMVNFWALI